MVVSIYFLLLFFVSKFVTTILALFGQIQSQETSPRKPVRRKPHRRQFYVNDNEKYSLTIPCVADGADLIARVRTVICNVIVLDLRLKF